MAFHEDDWVEVLNSNSNYKGPGQLVSPVFGTSWLVKVNRTDGKPGLIVAREGSMRQRGGPPGQVKAEPPAVDDESRYQDEQFAGLTPKQVKRLQRRLDKKRGA